MPATNKRRFKEEDRMMLSRLVSRFASRFASGNDRNGDHGSPEMLQRYVQMLKNAEKNDKSAMDRYTSD